jgi:hypothetical protein
MFSISYLSVNYFKKIRLRHVFLVGIAVLILFHFVGEYVFLKFTLYSTVETPNSFSGLSKVIVISVLGFGILFLDSPLPLRLRIIFSTIVFTGFAIAVSTFSYAGLRLLDLIAFALPVSILMIHSEARRRFNWKIKLSFLLAGFVSAVFVYRGFLLEAGQGNSPFLPYEVFNSFFLILT